MSDDELLQAMWDVYTKTHPRDDRMIAMRAVLDVLHAHGYRRCAEGAGVTQWCAEVERVRANLKALEDEHIAYADDVGDALGQGEDEPLLTCARRVVTRAEKAGAEVERLRAELNEIASVLPGVAYMDPPDGGSPSIPEQFRRMRADAADFQWLRDNPEHPHYPYFEDGCWHFPYEVSNAGGSGGGVGLANFDTLHEAIDAAREGK